MPKRLKEVIRGDCLPLTFTYDGDTYTLERDRPVPMEYFLYSGSYALLRGWLRDWLTEKPSLGRKLLDDTEGPDIRPALKARIEADDAIRRAHPFTATQLNSAVRELSETDLREIVADLVSPKYTIPETAPLWTFQEARNTAMAIASSSQGRWEKVPNEAALLWRRDGDPLEVKFLADKVGAKTHDAACKALHALNVTAVVCFQILLHALISIEDDYVSIDLDDLVRVLRFPIRTGRDRIAARETVWAWIRDFDSMVVIGTRPRHGPESDLRSEDSLIRTASYALTPSQQPEDAPFVVNLHCGSWLKRHRRNHRITQYFGEMMRVASIPTGKVAGAWAVSIGIALLQRWWEKASRSTAGRVGDQKHHTVRTSEFTRAELLRMFPPRPTVDGVLRGPHPQHAIDYWDAAIEMLRSQSYKTVGYSPSPPKILLRRKGWRDDWLSEPLEIRPAGDATLDLVEIQHASGTAARRRPRLNSGPR